ncbi:disulfide bond formation protein B, partial [Escherichia sp. TWPC-MK]
LSLPIMRQKNGSGRRVGWWIYERCALFGVLGAALIGAIAPKTPLRYVAMVIWLYSAFRGVQLTYEHTMLQLYPSPFATCDFMVRFPEWLPLGVKMGDPWFKQKDLFRRCGVVCFS